MIKSRLYNCDFRDVIDEVRADERVVVITDPPYNIGFEYSQYDDALEESEYRSLLGAFDGLPAVVVQYPEAMFKSVVPALGEPDRVMAWCYNSNLPRQMRLVGCFNVLPELARLRQPYKNPNDKRIQQRLAQGHLGGRLYDWWSDIHEEKGVTKKRTGNSHPCPIPLALAERLILLTTKPGDLVFDPFAGSGTVLVAARRLRRRFVGCELDQTYARLALSRLLETDVVHASPGSYDELVHTALGSMFKVMRVKNGVALSDG